MATAKPPPTGNDQNRKAGQFTGDGQFRLGDGHPRVCDDRFPDCDALPALGDDPSAACDGLLLACDTLPTLQNTLPAGRVAVFPAATPCRRLATGFRQAATDG